MSDLAIRVEGLSKRYDIATARSRKDTLVERVGSRVKSLFRPEDAEAPVEPFWALKDVSFEVRLGEIVGIIGHNGAGKSTLLKIISQITVPTSGRAELYGRVGSLLEVGTGFHPELTGRENIYLNGAIIGMKKEEIRRRFDAIVDFAGIGQFLDTPVKRYSSGMYVRLGFSVAAHLEPEILLVDEVLAVGDTAFQKKCLDKIGEAAKEGRTVLFISHSMTAVNTLCQRVIWMSKGEVLEDGPSADIVTQYLAKTVQRADVSEEVWGDPAEAPGNATVRLHRIGVRRQDGTSDPLTMQTPFEVAIEYWNLVPDTHLTITLHLHTADGCIAFATGEGAQEAKPAGLFRSTCQIPANLLNSGVHRFVIMVIKEGSYCIFEYESRVAFEIIDVRKRLGTWYGKEPGVVQPVLNWRSERLPEVVAQAPRHEDGSHISAGSLC